MDDHADAARAAARLARDAQLRVRVVVERGPGAVAELREAARAMDVDVAIELTPASAIAYFAAGEPGDTKRSAMVAASISTVTRSPS